MRAMSRSATLATSRPARDEPFARAQDTPLDEVAADPSRVLAAY